ncbi:MAG: acyltransferase family protein [Hyphomicrobium sp.]
MASSKLTHRPEIDGLRAIAVLSVVFYHFSIPGFGGGFVGVDVFFAISGFLIGGLLWRELTTSGTLSLTNFFARRMRRLAPAYFVMAFVTLVVSYLILMPFDFREFGKELIASTAYLSNVHFFRESGYFDTDAESKILLHTWSLSVEEQFYIFLPLLLLFIRRNRNALIAVLAALFATSLALCIVGTSVSHTAAFFLFPFRAWELLGGVLLAIFVQQSAVAVREPSQAVSWIGLAMVLAATAFATPGPTFPGVQAMLPVFGALAILYNGRQDNVVNRVLSSPAFVFVGLISYSLYLWHWPVLTLSRYYWDGASQGIQAAAWLSLSFVLAWASWRYIEKPVRESSSLRPLGLFASVAASSLVLLLAGGAAYLKDGAPGRFDTAIRTHFDASADFLQDWSRCAVADTGPFQGVEVCPIGPEGRPTFVVWGDSHVRAFKEGLSLLADETKSSGLLIWRAGCPTLFDVRKQESATTRQQDEDCFVANARIRKALSQMKDVNALLLIGRWTYYAEGSGIGLDSGNTIVLSSAREGASPKADQQTIFSEAVDATLTELSKTFGKVVVLRQVPEIPQYFSRDVARRIAHHTITEKEAERLSTVAKADVIARTTASELPFKRLAEAGKIVWLDTWPSFCADQVCGAVHDGRSFYFDNNHITNTAARSVREIFNPVMLQNGKLIGKEAARP